MLNDSSVCALRYASRACCSLLSVSVCRVCSVGLRAARARVYVEWGTDGGGGRHGARR